MDDHEHVLEDTGQSVTLDGVDFWLDGPGITPCDLARRTC